MKKTLKFFLTWLMLLGIDNYVLNAQTVYKLTIQVNNPSLGHCDQGTAVFPAGFTVKVNAIPAEHCMFIGWSEYPDVFYQDISIVMESDITLTANFMALEQCTFSTEVFPVGRGTIAFSPQSGPYYQYDVITCTATPNPNYRFVNWEIGSPYFLRSKTNPLPMEVMYSTSLKAIFEQIPYYSLTTNPLGSGTIEPSGGTYVDGQNVTVKAVPAPGFAFNGWAGDASGFDNPLNMIIDTNKSIVASFVPIPDILWQLNGSSIFYNSGNVGIGCSDPSSTLSVNGNSQATEIEILTAPCSDFVFEKGYKLMNLTDLETYIKANKHLPEIPSAKEFSEKGYSVEQMDDLLLRKIEELTLYVIELKKKNIQIKNQILQDNSDHK